MSQEDFLMEFQKWEKISNFCFQNWFLNTYLAISCDPLDQSNSLARENLKPHVSRKLKSKLLKN